MSTTPRQDGRDAELLALTDIWAAQTLDRELKARSVFLPVGMEYEDLLVIARTAAWLAARSYDPARMMAFRTWVIGQIRHAILEACRKRQYGGARAGTVHRMDLVSLEALRMEDGERVEVTDPHNPYAAVDARIVSEFLARLLPPRTYAIFLEYFGNERTGREVGADHGITQNRVWQIIADGRARAQEALKQ